MNAWEPIAARHNLPEAPARAAFRLRRAAPADLPPPTPLVYASPHSGRWYPDDMMAATALDAQTIRRSEDALVDDLVAPAPDLGVALLSANYARAYIDLNRNAFELDQGMFADELPEFARARTARVAAGLGAIARVVAEGQEIYSRKLTFAEARSRIEGGHRPYHAALERLIGEAHRAHGCAVLVDWHSMPAAATRTASRERGSDFVLGDRFGSACSAALTQRVEQTLEAMGYRVNRKSPYAGGYTTEHYGRPSRRTHALQIEINRGLYLDEAALTPTAGFAQLRENLASLTRVLTATNWNALKAA